MNRITTPVLLILCPVFALVAEPGDKDAPKKVPASLTVENEQGKATAFSADSLGKLPRHRVKVTGHSGTPATYEGASLADVLRAAKITLSKELKGPLLMNGLLAEADDGYRVVFSLPEIDPDMTDKLVLVADHKDGKPLDDKEGPYRLIVPHDKRGMRWVRQVTRISIQRIGGDRPDPKADRAAAALRQLGGKVAADD